MSLLLSNLGYTKETWGPYFDGCQPLWQPRAIELCYADLIDLTLTLSEAQFI